MHGFGIDKQPNGFERLHQMRYELVIRFVWHMENAFLTKLAFSSTAIGSVSIMLRKCRHKLRVQSTRAVPIAEKSTKQVSSDSKKFQSNSFRYVFFCVSLSRPKFSELHTIRSVIGGGDGIFAAAVFTRNWRSNFPSSHSVGV